jgi:hypothetical protein
MTPKSALAHDRPNRKSNPAAHEAQALEQGYGAFTLANCD